MNWKAMKQSEVGAKGNHTAWEMIGHDTLRKRILIACTCHDKDDPNRDARWIREDQVL